MRQGAETYKISKAPLPVVDFRNRKFRLTNPMLQKDRKIRQPNKLNKK